MAEVFVFGSNQSGIHGAGSAAEAFKNHGALWGHGCGRQGNSYAIPTKDYNVRTTLPLAEIKVHVEMFLIHAFEHPEDVFNVVAIGCGFAGYTPEEIAPLFENMPPNVNVPKSFEEVFARRGG